MIRSVYFLPIVLTLVSSLGCSGSPKYELAAAKSAVDTASSEGAEKYAPEEAKKVFDTLTAAQQEIRAQENKLIKNYGQAREMLAAVRADAENLRSILPLKKEELRKKSLVSLKAATSAFNRARAFYDMAPKGRLSEDLIDTFENNLLILEADLADAQQLVTHEDYAAASVKAETVKDGAALLSGEMQQSLGKGSLKSNKSISN